MEGFIHEVARALYDKYGDQIASMYVVVPNRRAQLFFCDALSQLIRRPVWQPRFIEIRELMEHIAGATSSDRLRLVTELYRVYATHHNETFDSFYFWGDLLLTDFDQIDKYLIDPDILFDNIRDLKRLEADTTYLSDEQIRVIRRFWDTFNTEAIHSEEKQRFLKIWDTLGAIYHTFGDALRRKGLAYEGMVYRTAANRLQSTEAVTLPGERSSRYAIIGFNALSACEKCLFKHMADTGRTEFYWDYDSYYVDQPQFEAGMFLRDNLNHFPSPADSPVTHDHLCASKEITVVAAPSDSMQCKYVHQFLQEIIDRGETPDKHTAIVLTDESLLIPVLYAIPQAVESLNITMGYPLRQTMAYTFVERLIALQSHARGSGKGSYYHTDVEGLLNHPYLRASQATEAETLVQTILQRRAVYASADLFPCDGLISEVFQAEVCQTWQQLAQYIRRIIASVAMQSGEGSEDQIQRTACFVQIDEHITHIVNALSDSHIDVTLPVFCSLLRKSLQNLRMPYEGEPLSGVQVMGILETRNLDFRDVLILSANDDTFPGNRTTTSSFIPYNLRYGYGLPTPQHHEGVFAYYFYRLIQRAERVQIAFCSANDERHTGEPSRYVYQLEYESPHPIRWRRLQLDVNLQESQPIIVPKEGDVAKQLREFVKGGSRKLSPSSFNQYVACPLRFYLSTIARIQPDEELSEEVDLPMFGTILHYAMEQIYRPLVGQYDPRQAIEQLIGTPRIMECVQQAINEKYLLDPQASSETYGGNLILVRDVVLKYINSCILPFDAHRESPFTIQALETPIEWSVPLDDQPDTLRIQFKGTSDRIDLMDDGTTQIIDYKTGSPNAKFADIASLFSEEQFKEHNAAALQTLLYSLMHASTGRRIQPALYYVRSMQQAHYSPLLYQGNTPINSFDTVRDTFHAAICTTLAKLFDLQEPFTQCQDAQTCLYCDFNAVCRRRQH